MWIQSGTVQDKGIKLSLVFANRRRGVGLSEPWILVLRTANVRVRNQRYWL